MGRGVKVAVIGGVFAVMVGGAGYGAYNVVSALDGGGGSGAAGTAKKSGPPSGDEVGETTEKFFTAWEKGDATTAASYTNNATVAGTLLTAYGEAAHITDVEITPGTATGTAVPFTVKAKVSYEGATKPLTYKSKLTVVRGETSGRALVDWEPSVVHPQLKDGDTLVTEESATPQIQAVGRDGTVLTKEKYPSLGPVLDTLRQKYGDKAGGTPGVELMVRHTAAEAADTSLLTLTEGEPGKLETTLSASVQAAAEKAVKRYGESSV
ncbi:NTF2-like N-terminal transpeptidase domain-containing protein, partial [Streptomyces sp. NPDC057781]